MNIWVGSGSINQNFDVCTIDLNQMVIFHHHTKAPYILRSKKNCHTNKVADFYPPPPHETKNIPHPSVYCIKCGKLTTSHEMFNKHFWCVRRTYRLHLHPLLRMRGVKSSTSVYRVYNLLPIKVWLLCLVMLLPGRLKFPTVFNITLANMMSIGKSGVFIL